MEAVFFCPGFIAGGNKLNPVPDFGNFQKKTGSAGADQQVSGVARRGVRRNPRKGVASPALKTNAEFLQGQGFPPPLVEAPEFLVRHGEEGLCHFPKTPGVLQDQYIPGVIFFRFQEIFADEFPGLHIQGKPSQTKTVTDHLLPLFEVPEGNFMSLGISSRAVRPAAISVPWSKFFTPIATLCAIGAKFTENFIKTLDKKLKTI
jgi:hypothetical protein